MSGRVAYIAASLDGFIAAEDGSVAWLEAFQATDYGYADFFAGIGTLVMGRSTYDQVLRFGPWPYAGRRCLVLSRRGIAHPPEGVEAWKGDLAALAAHLREASERVWVVGGGKLIAGLLAEGAITELDLFTMPVVEPYAISDPFSTDGKVNLNYQIMPFGYLKRSTALRAELDLFTMPVLLGRGIPLFAGGHPPAQKLSLLDTQSWPNGVVRLRYAIG